MWSRSTEVRRSKNSQVGVLAGQRVVGAADPRQQARQRVDRDASARPRAAALETSIASVVLPVPTSPISQSPRPSSSRSSIASANSRTTAEHRSARCRRSAGELEADVAEPLRDHRARRRARGAWATSASRHSHGRATFSGPTTQPDPSQTPEHAGGRPADSRSALVEPRAVAHASSATSISGGPSPAPLLDRPLAAAGTVDEARVLLQEDERRPCRSGRCGAWRRSARRLARIGRPSL